MTKRLALLATLLGPVVIVLTMSKIHARYVADPPYDYTGSFRFAWSIAYMAILIVSAYGLGLPDLTRSIGGAVRAAALSSLLGALAMSAVQLVVGDALLPRFVVFGTALLLIPWQVAVGAITRRRLGIDATRDRVVLVSDSDEARLLLEEQRSSPEKAWMLHATLTPAQIRASEDRRLLVEAVLDGGTVVVLDRSALLDDEVVADAGSLHEYGVRVRTLVDFYAEWLGKLPASELERSSLFFDIAEVHRVPYARMKRVGDVVGGLLFMIPLVIATPIVWVMNLVGSRGPLFYRQPRVGLRGEEFTILKFRTMVPSRAPAGTGTEWTAANDPRITTVGKFLRTTHLDELPQAWNIVRGDLSLVGPRPEQPHYVVQLSAKLPFYGMRHLVRPGLTGWAQVKYGYAADERDALEKLQYEFFYLRRQGIRFDLKVLGRTIRSVLGSEGSGR